MAKSFILLKSIRTKIFLYFFRWDKENITIGGGYWFLYANIYYLLFFTLGNLITEHFSKFENKINFKINIVLGIIIFVIMLVYSINLQYIKNMSIFLALLVELLGCYFWFIIAKCIVKSNKIK